MKKVNLFFVLFFFSIFFSTIEAKEISLSSFIDQIVQTTQNSCSSSIPIVAIGGCPGVGKTYFTKMLATLLQQRKINCYILALDHFNLPLQERKKIGTEWDIRHFRSDELHHVLQLIKQNKIFFQKPICNQLTGEIKEETVDLSQIDVILFDGLYTLCTHNPIHFFSYADIGIFIDANEKDIYQWKWEREQKKSQPRNGDEFAKHMEAILTDYKKNIAYTKKSAHFIITKDSSHQYLIEEHVNK
ncbi:MAG: hypothetical protein BGO10_09915 [Chlamydia sp. 32-24]|nr:MAG: hypothetical protein BGO10_09915 [Chlamydia sp. 32-24]